MAYNHSHLRNRDSFRAKIVVNAYMSVECAFKSLICSRDQTQDACKTFRVILGLGHNLRRLMQQSAQTVLSSKEKAFLEQAAKMGVRLRYSVDLFNLSRCDLIPNDTVSFHLDDQYVKTFLQIARKVSDCAQRAHHQTFPACSPVMTERDVAKYIERLRRLQPALK